MAVGLALLGASRPACSQAPAKVEDAWAGSYSAAGAGKITITKEGGVYKLSKPYHLAEFREVKKDILEDAKGGLGRIHLGSARFGDGRRSRVLRAEFRYETFYMIEPDDARGPARPEPLAKKPKPLTVGHAEMLVRALIYREKPAINPDAQFPLKDITTKAVWDRLGVQVFQVTEGVQHFETFVVRKGKAPQRIGKGIGGQGVTSLAVADLDGDGRGELIYAYSWGSGEHRSHVAVFDCSAKAPKETTAPQAYFGKLGDLAVKNGKAGVVEVYAGMQKVGRLELTGKGGTRKANIRLEDDLPAAVTAGFRGVE